MKLSTIGHTNHSFQLLTSKPQKLVGRLAEILEIEKIERPFEARELISLILDENEIDISDQLFERLDFDDSLEMWSSDANFLFAMGDILSLTSYSLDELATQPWHELFDRDSFFKMQIQNKFIQALTTGKVETNVTEWHMVRELRSPKMLNFEVKVKQITPFTDNDGMSGVVAIVKARPLSY